MNSVPVDLELVQSGVCRVGMWPSFPPQAAVLPNGWVNRAVDVGEKNSSRAASQ